MNTRNKLSFPEPLAEYLSTYCNVNAMEMVMRLRDNLQSGAIRQKDADLFQKQLAIAIVKDQMTPTEYTQLTGDIRHNSIAELNIWLRKLWVKLFGDKIQPEEVVQNINKA